MSPNVPATREARELPAIEAAMEPHVERIRAAAAGGLRPEHPPRLPDRMGGVRPVGRWRRVPGPPRRARRRRRLPRGPVRSGALPLFAPSGPPGDPCRPPRGGRGGPVRLRRRPARPPGPLASAGGAGGEASGGRAHRRSAGRDPRHGRRSPHGPHQPDGIPPKRPGSGEPWTSPSPPSCATPCSGAPKRPRSNGPMSSSGRMDRDGSGSAARRPTRRAREPSSTSGRGPPPLSGRSAPGTRIRTPACSASAPDAPWPAASPPWPGPPGSKARSPDTRPASGWPAISWPPGPPSPPSRSRAGGSFRPDARPLRPGRAGRTRGRRPVLRGVRVPPGPRIPGPKAAGSPLTAFGPADGPEERGDVRVGRGRHPSPLASFGPDRSDRLHVYR